LFGEISVLTVSRWPCCTQIWPSRSPSASSFRLFILCWRLASVSYRIVQCATVWWDGKWKKNSHR